MILDSANFTLDKGVYTAEASSLGLKPGFRFPRIPNTWDVGFRLRFTDGTGRLIWYYLDETVRAGGDVQAWQFKPVQHGRVPQVHIFND
jgi:hypothetical protein